MGSRRATGKSCIRGNDVIPPEYVNSYTRLAKGGLSNSEKYAKTGLA